ncbi:uncharacterized protein LOC124896913 [Capsicum annuum]|uniref:uncharacterized protein LOC124896913 n=1 Tax=Capsicum annuum TaxID=4072 RepID=UPI001FB0E2A6|nr:uncharacterized protein LOC124896913 [Capsicum annuum]
MAEREWQNEVSSSSVAAYFECFLGRCELSSSPLSASRSDSAISLKLLSELTDDISATNFTPIWWISAQQCVYATGGLDEEDKKRFWEVLDEVVRGVPSSEMIFIGRDFNGHIGSLSMGYDDVLGGFGFEDKNVEGAALLDFVSAFGLAVVNSSFSKKEKHLVTFRSRLSKT